MAEPESIDIRNRVRELRLVAAKDLHPDPRNARRHGAWQRSLLKAMQDEVGIVAAVLAREAEDGKLILVDGHMRQEEAEPDELLPTLIVDLTEEEAGKVLLTHDPIAALADIDAGQTRALAEAFDTQNANLRKFLQETEEENEEEEDDEGDGDGDNEHDIANMELEPHEHYDYLVVLCSNTHEWNVLCDKLKLEPVKRRKRMGTGRAIHAAQLFELLALDAEQKVKQ